MKKGKKNIGNYHLHTYEWSDGRDKAEEMVKEAIKAGLTEIGFTDHFSTEKVGKSVNEGMIPDYIQMIKKLNEKYSDKIRILAGLEIDTTPFNPHMASLPFKELNKLDYVLFEYVEDYSLRGCTLDELLQIRKSLKCDVGLAHPNIKLNFSHFDPKQLASLLKKNNIFLDTFSGDRGDEFFCGLLIDEDNFRDDMETFLDELKKAGVEFAPSTDSHTFKDLGKAAIAEKLIEKHRLALKSFKQK